GPRGRPLADGSPPPTPAGRHRSGSFGAAPLGPARLDFREDALAELVAGTGERKGHVRMEALETSPTARAADAERERGAAGAAGRVAGELRSQQPLLLVAGREARGQGRLGARRGAPALDAAGCFEAGHGRDQIPAREVVRRRERLTVRRVR